MTAKVRTVAITALLVVLAIGTGAYAADRIGSKQIKAKAVKARHLAPNSVKNRHLAENANPDEIFRVTASGTGSVTATCPPGFVVIGGGFTGVQGGQVTTSDSGGDFNRWTVTVSGSNQPFVATAYCFTS